MHVFFIIMVHDMLSDLAENSKVHSVKKKKKNKKTRTVYIHYTMIRHINTNYKKGIFVVLK